MDSYFIYIDIVIYVLLSTLLIKYNKGGYCVSIKEMWEYLLNKKWESDEIWMLILYIFIASIFTTPLLGVPIGVIAYLYLSDDKFN